MTFERVCSSCGAQIVWAVTAGKKKRMPLDFPPERRFVIRNPDEGKTPEVEFVNTYVSHFATCPNAEEHRR